MKKVNLKELAKGHKFSKGSGIIVGSTGLISTSASAIPDPTTIQINVTYPSGSLVDYVMINVT